VCVRTIIQRPVQPCRESYQHNEREDTAHEAIVAPSRAHVYYCSELPNDSFACCQPQAVRSRCRAGADASSSIGLLKTKGPGRGWEFLRQGKSPLIARTRRARHGVQSVQDDNAATLTVLDIPSNRGTVVRKNPWEGNVSSPARANQRSDGARVCARNASSVDRG
jgi:hypothetical protein